MDNTQIVILHAIMGKEIYLKDFVKDEVIPLQMSLFGEQKIRPIDFCDPRGSDESDKGKSSVQVLNEMGIYPAYRRTWIEEGLNIMKGLMDTVHSGKQEPNFLIHPRAKDLVEAFKGGYHRDGEDKPVKDGFYDNLMDATRYLCLHAVQRSKISVLMNKQSEIKKYVNPHTGRILEF